MKSSLSTAQRPTARCARCKTFSIALLAGLALIFLASCKKEGASANPTDVAYYTCTMHPSVRSQDPKAKCPICGMNLVPDKKKGGGGGHDHGQMKGDAKSMGMSPEEHAKMSGGKGKDDMKGMKGMEGMKDMKGMEGMKGAPGMQKG